MPMDPYIQTLLAHSTECYGTFSSKDPECSVCTLNKPCSADRIRKFRSLVDQVRLVKNQVVTDDGVAAFMHSDPPPAPSQTKTPKRTAASSPAASSPAASSRRVVFAALDDAVCGRCHQLIAKGAMMYHDNMSVYHEGC